MNAQAALLSACISTQVAVNSVQLLDMDVIDKPHCPHGILPARSLKHFVPDRRQCVWDVRTKMRRDRRLVLMKPVLNTTTDTVCNVFEKKSILYYKH